MEQAVNTLASDTTANAEITEPALFSHRLGAYIFDGTFLQITSFLISLIIYSINPDVILNFGVPLDRSIYFGSSAETFIKLIKISNYTNFVVLLLGFVYYIYFFSRSGVTLGKKLFGLKVVSINSEKLDVGKGIIRTIGYYISAIPLFLGFFWMLFDEKKQTWHDKMSGTKVIKVSNKDLVWPIILTVGLWLATVFAIWGLFFTVAAQNLLLGGQPSPAPNDYSDNGSVFNDSPKSTANVQNTAELTSCGLIIEFQQDLNAEQTWRTEHISSPNIAFPILDPSNELIKAGTHRTKLFYKAEGPFEETGTGLDIRCFYNGQGFTIDDLQTRFSYLNLEEAVIANKKALKFSSKNSTFDQNYILLSPDEAHVVHIGVNYSEDLENIAIEGLLENIR